MVQQTPATLVEQDSSGGDGFFFAGNLLTYSGNLVTGGIITSFAVVNGAFGALLSMTKLWWRFGPSCRWISAISR